MEPKMISLKILSTAAAMALLLPMVVPSESFAQSPPTGRSAGNVRAGVGPGGGGGRNFSGGAVRNFGGGAPVARFNGGVGGGQRFTGGGRYAGGGGYYRRGDRGFVGGAAVAGALVGGAIASQSYGYYGGGPTYAPGYYDDQYYDDSSVVAVAPAPGGDDAVAYCTQTYRSYDPGSGTYLGYDGLRHPCP
jgi:hypothetical protein